MKDKDILKLARERYALEKQANDQMRARQKEDAQFKAGEQWPAAIKSSRENDPYGARPCLVINHARTHANNIINDIRQNRPQIKVLPVDSDADVDTAEVLNGLIRHIQVSGDADLAYDTATAAMVDCGEGFFEIVTRELPGTDDLELDIEEIVNGHSVHMDPHHEKPTGEDAKWCFIDDPQLRADLERENPKAELTDWDTASKDTELAGWYLDEDTVNCARYYYREDTDEGHIWHVCKLVGDAILEQSIFPGNLLPVIRVVGEETFKDGHRDTNGVIRPIKDPCRQYNYWASVNTERIALSPKAPYVGAAGAFDGFEEEWNLANTANIPRLTYNAFDEEGRPLPPPSRTAPISQDTAIVNAMLQAHDDIKAVSGKFDASLGNRSNETSGVAIANRQRQGDVATFHFVDNLSRSIRQAGRVLVGLIPLVYTSDRVIRILGEDDEPDFAQVSPTGRALTETRDAAGKIERIYDLGVGVYDVTVKAGPSYSTRRQEAVAEMSELLRGSPEAFQLIGHKLIRNMDWPGADEAADILEAMLPPQVKAIIDAKKEGGDQVAMQVEQAQSAIMDQVEPAMQSLQQQVGQASEAAQKASQENQTLKIALAAKDLDIKQLQMALSDKSGELQLEAQKIQADTLSKTQDAETKIVIAAMQNDDDDEPQEKQSDEWTANTVAAQAAQQAVEQMTALAQALSKQTSDIAAAGQETAKLLSAVAQSHEQMSGEVIQLKDYIAKTETVQQKKERAVLRFLKSDGGDAELKKTVSTIEKL